MVGVDVMNRLLGGVEYPYNPNSDGFSGVNVPKKRADYRTFAGNLTLNWGLDVSSMVITEQWDYVEDSFYQLLLQLYELNQEYSYRPHDGYIYLVEIADFDAAYWGKYEGTEYWTGVVLKLQVNKREKE